MNNIMKILAVTVFAAFISISFAQEKSDGEHKQMKCCEKENGKTDNGNMEELKGHEGMNMHKKEDIGMSVIRKGAVDLKEIDKNKDGKVFQDMMDWNVISDEAGECPLCGMTLKEVTLKKAEENLLKNNFKVKE